MIIDHYDHYLKSTGLTLKDTNGEFTESLHSTIRKFEETHTYRITKSVGSPSHHKESLDGHTQVNSRRVVSSTLKRMM